MATTLALLVGTAVIAACSSPDNSADGTVSRQGTAPATQPRPQPLDAPAAQTAATTGTAVDAPSQQRTRLWQCDSTRIQVQQDGQRARLNFNGRKLELARASSPNGERFSDASGNALQDDGSKAILTLAGKAPLACEPSDVLSPWVQAEQSGAVFRAAGNEPGWTITVDGHTPTRLHAQLDYGERDFTIAVSGADGSWHGQAPNGSALQVQATRSPCEDDMSGASFEATVNVQVGDRQYRGCGAWLTD